MPSSWYVARTNPRAEFMATNQLENDGFEYYLPLVSTPSQNPAKPDAPLFPGYLFLRYDAESPKSVSLRSVRGLIGLVNFDGVAPCIPDDVISRLRQTVADMNESGGLASRFLPGERVWVRWGASDSEDLAKVVSDAKSPGGRVKVLVEFLGRLVSGEVSRSNIRSANTDEAVDQVVRDYSRRRTRGKGRYVHGVALRPA